MKYIKIAVTLDLQGLQRFFALSTVKDGTVSQSVEKALIVNNKQLRRQAEINYRAYLACLEDIAINSLTNKALKTRFKNITIRSYGRPLKGHESTTLISAEFDFNFMGMSVITPTFESQQREEDRRLKTLVFFSLDR